VLKSAKTKLSLTSLVVTISNFKLASSPGTPLTSGLVELYLPRCRVRVNGHSFRCLPLGRLFVPSDRPLRLFASYDLLLAVTLRRSAIGTLPP